MNVTVQPATVEVELPDEVPMECLGVYTLVVGYHHGLGTDAWRRLVAGEIGRAAAEVMAGLHDPEDIHA